MFTWECPTCGREIDIADSECPNCSKKAKASQAAVATEEPPAAAPAPREQLPEARRARAPQRPRPAGSWGLQGKHVALFGLLALIAIAAAVYFARPDLFRRGPKLEDVPAAEGSGDSGSAYLGEIEVAGVRTWYGPEYKSKVSVVVINHSEDAQMVNLKVELRTRESPRTATPLGTFEIHVDKALAPREARNVETDLTSLGTLASLPPWQQLRVDVQQP